MKCQNCNADMEGRWCPACLHDSEAPPQRRSTSVDLELPPLPTTVAGVEQLDADIVAPVESEAASVAAASELPTSLPPVGEPQEHLPDQGGNFTARPVTAANPPARTCAACGSALEPTHKHCPQCGTRVFSLPTPPPTSAKLPVALESPLPPVAAPPALPTARAHDDAPAAYSGWWRRFWALLIDSLIVDIGIGLVVAFCFGLTLAGGILLAIPLGIAGVLCAYPGYFTYFHGKHGATWGKMALGIRVGDAESGAAIGYGRAFGRWCAQYLLIGLASWLVIPWLLNYLWPLWDDKRQCWHDKLVGSSVFRK